MYQPRVRHLLSPASPAPKDDVEGAMYELFVAIGTFWGLTDDPTQYRVRLRAFMTNRINLDPKYRDYYVLAQKVIAELIAQKGEAAAYAYIFTNKKRILPPPPPPPQSELEYVQVYVANEFIAFRLAVGGFAAFGALNYRGYFGGANISEQPVPYRPMADRA